MASWNDACPYRDACCLHSWAQSVSVENASPKQFPAPSSTSILVHAGSAKLSGSGGAVVVYLPDRKQHGKSFHEACRREGFDVYDAICGPPSEEISTLLAA